MIRIVYKSALLWMATISLAIQACALDISTNSFELRDVQVTLISIQGLKPLNVLVSFEAQTIRTNDKFNWGSATDFRSREHALLAVYLDNCALRYVEGGALPANVTISCLEGTNAMASARKQASRWFFNDTNVDFCKETLALRQGTNVIQLLPISQPASPVWMPFNRANYDLWWHGIDSRLNLSDTFNAK
jgi:hypothetical protein